MSQDAIDTLLQSRDAQHKPDRDLWPGIERGLSSPAPQPRARRPWANVASLLLALLLGTGFGLGGAQWFDRQKPDYQEAMSSLITVLASQHQQQLERMQTRYGALSQSPISLPLDSTEESRQALRQAGAELQQALQQQPDNRQLLELWLWVQQKEKDLILSQNPSLRMQPL